MRSTFISAALALSTGVSALPQNAPASHIMPALPIHKFEDTPKFAKLLSLDEILTVFKNITDKVGGSVDGVVGGITGGHAEFEWHSSTEHKEATKEDAQTFSTAAVNDEMSTQATCSNPSVRQEWDSYSDSDRQAFVDSIKCLMGRPPSGQFGNSKSRYEDFVALHQTLTPNVHGNAKFLLWHRYYLYTFESILRSDCGFDRAMPWFDETRYSGRFADSSVFSSRWFGSINVGGNCVTDGQFANLGINIGPGQENIPHCLARNNDDSRTANTNNAMVDSCNNLSPYSQMASCAEGGAHAWGHNGIGAVMQDVWASPADPVFWLHHGFVDRNFRIWQNKDGARVNQVDGNDAGGNAITLDTNVNVYGFRADVKIRDILDTTSTTLCYKYNY